MRFYPVFRNFINKNSNISHIFRDTILKKNSKAFTCEHSFKYVSSIYENQYRKKHLDTFRNAKNVSEIEDLELLETEVLEEEKTASLILFNKSEDDILHMLSKAASIEEVFMIFTDNKTKFNCEHITQTILVLYDLQKIYFKINMQPNASSNFAETVFNSNAFRRIINLIDIKLNKFDTLYLSYTFLYLNKLGFNINNCLMQKIDNFMRFKLEKDFNLHEASNYFKTIFLEDEIKPIYQVVNIIPNVFKSIDDCSNIDDVGYLTDCLNKLHLIVNTDEFERYKKKIKSLLGNGILTSEHTKVLIKIILLINYPHWRVDNSEFISKCILLMEKKIDAFTLDELILLYGVFFKNQEPGDILTAIQRNASKFIRQMEEYGTTDMEKKVKLFSSLIYFSSPLHKVEYRKVMADYIDNSFYFPELFNLRKLLCYVKIKDKNLCNKYWDKVLEAAEKQKINIYIICQNYLNFKTDLEDFRHYEIENYLNKKLIEELRNGNVTILPSNLIDCLCFFLSYGKNKEITENLIYHLGSIYTQISEVDCLKISQHILSSKIRPSLKQDLRGILNRATEHIIAYKSKINATVLFKACVVRNDTDHDFINDLITYIKNTEPLSSKTIENMVYCLMTTNVLVPEIINKVTSYIVNNRRSMLAFNVDKVLFLCFFLGYCPINAESFFPIASDIILRDQERLSGLSFLQSALALCYFNRLPNSFIRQIFNVEFMDKLDIELANCYYKDKYPQRVRQHLMELNRSVCLEYPENNVPWFHQKYTDEIIKKLMLEKSYPKYFTTSVKEYLAQVIDKEEYLTQDVRTPYGYYIDFVVYMNHKQEIVSETSKDITSKIALLLVRPHVFTKFYINLKGKFQMKKRHLEMFGYTVSIINIDEWLNLLYAEERLEFLKNKIWLEEQK
ncbi:unnamed protein product [Brassicogethes aeneus]|uniref:RAP domain-containing protein n=1 Tax=Brassicogethes aeneus TaxID=1431903 RepID=A0A9P0BD41_BRAAE|nr:unnamed protein product [Brassicogethes aeneus]